MQQITPGRIVNYKCGALEVLPAGSNSVNPGDVYPAIVVRVWSDNCVNLQVFVDGPGTIWATSRVQGDGLGQWSWPERIPTTESKGA